MLPGLPTTEWFVRGATVFFFTTFFDVDGNVTQPASATLSLFYNTPSASGVGSLISMTPPSSGGTQWTAEWDTRGVSAPQTAQWAIYSSGSPAAVGEGVIRLEANAANPLTFS